MDSDNNDNVDVVAPSEPVAVEEPVDEISVSSAAYLVPLKSLTELENVDPSRATPKTSVPRPSKGRPTKARPPPKDPLLQAYDDIREHVYAENPSADEHDDSYLGDLSVEEAMKQAIRKVSSKPDNDLDDLTAYIQGQLKGKDGDDGDPAKIRNLVPVPMRYRRPYRTRSREELDPTPKPKRLVDPPVLFQYAFPDENSERDKNLLDDFMGLSDHVAPPLPVEAPSQKSARRSRAKDGKEGKEDLHFQRIFPEDPTWKLTTVDRLSEVCYQVIQDNFQDMPYQLAALPTEIQQRFVPDLPVASEVNLYLAADFFHNEDYWERSCKSRWGRNVFVHIHGSWKLTYIEKGFQEMMENYVPLQSDPNILLNDLLNVGEYVLHLEIEQLLPPVRHSFGDFAAMVDAQLTNHVHFTEPYEESEFDTERNRRRSSVLKAVPMADEVKKFIGKEAEAEGEFPAVKNPTWSDKAKIKFQRLVNRELDLNRGLDEGDRILMNITRDLDDTPAHPRTVNPFLAADHMNLVPVVANMPHLMDLKLRYGVRDCGMNFSWRLYQFTFNDAKRLAEALVICPSLRRLSLQNSSIDDQKGAIVCSALLDHPNLAILELPNNKLGDKTAAVIGRMIKRSEVLNKVDLSENQIGVAGAKYLARSFVRGTSLRILNLHMNEIGDLGAEAIFLVLKSCITFLQQIGLSGNGITGAVVDLMTDAMRANKRVEKYDLSTNKFEGVTVSRKIQEALTQSHHIQHFNVKGNSFPVEFEACVQEIVSRNQDGRLEEVLTEMEHTFDFNIRNVKFPTEQDIRENSEGDSDSTSTASGDGASSKSSRSRRNHSSA